MRSQLLALTALVVTGCGEQPMDAVSIRPIYGYVDGCTQVTIGGHGFGDDVTVTIGGQALVDPSLPDAATNPLDVGFAVYGSIPASTSGKGFADVAVTTGGETDTIVDGYYYVDCPGVGYIEEVSPASGISAGDTISLAGCGMDAAAYTVRVGDAKADAALTSACSSAQVSFQAPAVSADGTWYIGFFDSTGTQVSPDPACDITLPAGSSAGGDTGDTGWSDPCASAVAITYGGE